MDTQIAKIVLDARTEVFMKINKIETFNLNRAISDYQSGRLESLVAKPDFSAIHQPHVDLTVRPVGQETLKYRIYDTVGAGNLLKDCGREGIKLP